MAGVAGRVVEPAAVVPDLEHDARRPGLDPDPRLARMGVLHHVGERLAADAEELGLRAARQGQAALRTADVDDQPLPCADPRGVLGERGHEPVLHRAGAELEDECPHLALRTARELADRAESPSERSGRAHALLLQAR